MLVAGTHALGLCSATFPSTLAESWVGESVPPYCPSKCIFTAKLGAHLSHVITVTATKFMALLSHTERLVLKAVIAIA